MKKGLLFLILSVLGLGACGVTNPPPDDYAIANLCATIDRTGYKTLLTPKSKQDVLKQADDGGIPKKLKDATYAFYQGELLDGAQVETFTNDRRKRLDDKKDAVLRRCHELGWNE